MMTVILVVRGWKTRSQVNGNILLFSLFPSVPQNEFQTALSLGWGTL
jgi:hypothetical protein